ncbi:MAG: ABC transporter permease [Pseudomonadota bacterium]
MLCIFIWKKFVKVNMWIIFKKEILSKFKSIPFNLSLIFCVILSISMTYIMIKTYNINRESYNAGISILENNLRNSVAYINLTPYAAKAPEKLSIISMGIDDISGNYTPISISWIPRGFERIFGGNYFLSIFEQVDMAIIFKVILALLTILIMHNFISKEAEDGNLKLLCSNHISIHEIVWSKYLSGVLVLGLFLFLSFLAFFISCYFILDFYFSIEEVLRILISVFIFVLYLSIFALISIFLSLVFKRSSSVLVTSLLVWIFISFLANGLIALSGKYLVKAPPWESIQSQLDSYYNERSEELRKIRHKFPPIGTKCDIGGIIPYAEKEVMYSLQKRYTEEVPIKIEYAAKKLEIYNLLFDKQIAQLKFINKISQISPSYLLDDAISRLSFTNYGNYFEFWEQAMAYREEYVDYIMKNKIYTKFHYFTPLKEHEFPKDLKQFNAMDDKFSAEGNFVSKFYFHKYLPTLKLDHLPRFSYKKPALTKDFSEIRSNILILIMMNFLLVLLIINRSRNYVIGDLC